MRIRLTLLALFTAAAALAQEPAADKPVTTKLAARKKVFLGAGPLQVTSVRAKGEGYIFLFMGFRKTLGDADCAEPAIENGTTGWIEDGGTLGSPEIIEPNDSPRTVQRYVPPDKVLCVVAEHPATVSIGSHKLKP
jgi:hypothetical protein